MSTFFVCLSLSRNCSVSRHSDVALLVVTIESLSSSSSFFFFFFFSFLSFFLLSFFLSSRVDQWYRQVYLLDQETAHSSCRSCCWSLLQSMLSSSPQSCFSLFLFCLSARVNPSSTLLSQIVHLNFFLLLSFCTSSCFSLSPFLSSVRLSSSLP